MTKTQELIHYHETDPEAMGRSSREIADEFECDPSLVCRARRHIREGGRRSKPKSKPKNGSSDRIDLRIQGTMEVGVYAGGSFCGTLVVSSGGLKYVRPSQKLRPDREIPWDKLSSLMAVFE